MVRPLTELPPGINASASHWVADYEVQTIQLALDAMPDAKALACCSPEERARAERFVHTKDRAHFLQSRGWLREVLGFYLGLEPEQVAIQLQEQGKPYCESQTPLYFNLSHAGGYFLLALSYRGEVGVDIEKIDRAMDHHAIARRFFSAEECEVLARADSEVVPELFTRFWVRKEAYVKCTGEGLFAELTQVGLSKQEPGCYPLADGKVLVDLEAGEGFLAALVFSH